ncbi:flagellum-specific ATP synthase FliI [Photobacterium aphoticum]|uniref:H(+)-transporting two-sector ATPase n=1 Tax=Photobacterium aphoticum TaxID=754436 RepID=A0A090QVJ4_9GAMM|nr:flagellum-specific ATP synthase FliI [Photobacterium aphoticum]
MLTVGKGQRIGLFAGSGVGKSVTLGMMTRGTTAQVVVVGLIGERGREVKEFIDEILGHEGRQRAVVVAAPADASPLMRLKGCQTALTIAEYFRDQGLDVLLLMDSLTVLPKRSVRLPCRWVSRRRPKAIRLLCLPNYLHWSSGPVTVASIKLHHRFLHRTE